MPSKDLFLDIVSRSRQEHRLLSVHWALTHRCNQRCSHCYLDIVSPHARVPEELDTDQCLRILDDMASMGVLNLTFSGGEILVRRDFFKIAEHAHAKRFLLRLFTNGTCITPRMADRIAALHPYGVEISLYGVDAATHDQITGLPRSFDLSLRALVLLHERGVRTTMKTPLMKENVHQFRALEALANDLGIHFQYDITITPKDDGCRSTLRHRISQEDLISLFRATLDPGVWTERTVPVDQPTCNIAGTAVALDPYGNVYPCEQVRIRVGNVLEQSLKQIWTSSPVWRSLSNLTKNKLILCNTCELSSLCLRCHGLAQLEDGDMSGPSTINCHQALARRQVLVEKGALPCDFPIPAHLQ